MVMQHFDRSQNIIDKYYSMKFLMSVLLSFILLNADAQLEKMGLYAGTSLIVHNYRSNKNGAINGNGFFSQRYRVGVMTSFYGDERFSYETGILTDYHHIKNNKTQNLNFDDGVNFSLENHNYVNLGIPLSITIRTNVTPSCVTYFKFSMINLFTINNNQSVTNNRLTDELSYLPHKMVSTNNDIQYYSTDFDFGFGTFWYIKKIRAKFCLEPRVTFFQYRGAMNANHLPDRKIMHAHSKLLSSLGFEIMFYKDLY